MKGKALLYLLLGLVTVVAFFTHLSLTGVQGAVEVNVTIGNTAPEILTAASDSRQCATEMRNVSQPITFSVTWQDPNSDQINMSICRTNFCGAVGCASGQTLCSLTSNTSTTPAPCSYTAVVGDTTNTSYYACIVDTQNQQSATNLTYSLVNHAPVCTAAPTLGPAVTFENGTLTCSNSTGCVDSDIATCTSQTVGIFNYSWANGGGTNPGNSTTATGTYFNEGNGVTCSNTAHDSLGYFNVTSTPAASSAVTILNSPAIINQTITVSGGTPGSTVTLTAGTITDQDGYSDFQCGSTTNCNFTCWGGASSETSAQSYDNKVSASTPLTVSANCYGQAGAGSATGNGTCLMNASITVTTDTQSRNGTWTCSVRIADNGIASSTGVQSRSQNTFSMNPIASCSISAVNPCPFNAANPGAGSGNDANVTTYTAGACLRVNNTGNTPIDILVLGNGSALSCWGGPCGGSPTQFALTSVGVRNSSNQGMALSSSANVTIANGTDRDVLADIIFNRTANFASPQGRGWYGSPSPVRVFCKPSITLSALYGPTFNLNMTVNNVVPATTGGSFEDTSGASPGTLNPGQTYVVNATGVSDANGAGDISCTSTADSCGNLTCYWTGSTGCSASTISTPESWDANHNTSYIQYVSGTRVSAYWTLSQKALNGTWTCDFFVKDTATGFGGQGVSTLRNIASPNVNPSIGAASPSASYCTWTGLTPGSAATLYNGGHGCTQPTMNITNPGNTYFRLRSYMDLRANWTCVTGACSGVVIAGGNTTFNASALTGTDTCQTIAGTVYSSTANGTGSAINAHASTYKNRASNNQYGCGFAGSETGVNSSSTVAHICLAIPAGQPSGTYNSSIVITTTT